MTALTATTTGLPALPRPAGQRGVTFGGILRSEWIKFRTLRSTVWSLIATVLLMVGISVLVAWGTTSGGDNIEATGGGAAGLVTAGAFFAQLTVAVLGVLAITGEYSTGMIRSTLTAVPHRLPALWAKALVLAVVVAVVSAVGVALASLAAVPFHDKLGITLDLSDPETLRMLAGIPAYLTGIALLGFAIGALLRHSAGALATVLGLLLVVETVISVIPLRFFDVVEAFLPGAAGSRLIHDDQTLALMNSATTGPALSAWQGYGVLLGWVALLLALAAVLLRRRDA